MCRHAGAEAGSVLAHTVYPHGVQVQHAQAHAEKVVAGIQQRIDFVVAGINRHASKPRAVAIASMASSQSDWLKAEYTTPGGVPLKFTVASLQSIW